VLFAFDPTSAYHDGVMDLIRGSVKVIPWNEIGSVEYHLALTASENVTLDSITSPVIVLPHGIGFHKNVPSSLSADARVSGVVPAKYLRDGRVSMVVSHAEQEEQLRHSVTLYGAALDRPALLGNAATGLVPGTPPEEMAETVSMLSLELPLREQVDRAIETHRPGRFDSLRDRMFAHQGKAAEALRELIFAKLDLAVPATPATSTAVPAPRPEVRKARSFHVQSRMVRPGHVEVLRFPLPAAVKRERPGYLAHLCVGDGELLLSALENASVIVQDTVTEADEAAGWIAETLSAYEPFMAVAAVDDGCVIGTRDGRSMRCAGGPRLDAMLVSSGVYTLMRLGAVADGPVTVTAGGVRAEFLLRTGRQP
jgi:hypothetical protein